MDFNIIFVGRKWEFIANNFLVVSFPKQMPHIVINCGNRTGQRSKPNVCVYVCAFAVPLYRFVGQDIIYMWSHRSDSIGM